MTDEFNLKSKIQNLKSLSPKTVVLMGGPSAEHDISLKSGQGVAAALTERGWRAQTVVIPRELSDAAAGEHVRHALTATTPEVVFIALHGPFGEDGTVQQICEELQLPYTGSGVLASRLGLDKVASRLRFAKAGLAVPTWRLIESSDETAVRACMDALTFPMVIKPTNQGSSIGVSVARDPEELRASIEAAQRFDARVLAEEWIPGREVTVGILGQEPLPVVEIKPAAGFFDFRAKYTPGQTDYLVPAPLDQAATSRIQAAGVVAHHALGCRHFSRADLILSDAGQPVILEVNTIPGLTATSLLPKAARHVGIPYDELCERVVLMALKSVQLAVSVAP